MSLARDSRNEKKVKALLRAKFALKQKFDRIDFEEDVLYPEIERMKSGKGVLGLEDGELFELVIDRADPHPSEGSDR